MTGKAKGGRGQKALNPYERFTVSLPPDLKKWLDELTTRQGVTRSETLALLLTEARETSMKGKLGTPELPTIIEPPVQRPARKQVRGDKVTGRKLTSTQAQICAALQMSEAVAEYDYHERKWTAGHAGAPANLDDLEELARLGVLTKTGEGNASVYRLLHTQAKPRR